MSCYFSELFLHTTSEFTTSSEIKISGQIFTTKHFVKMSPKKEPASTLLLAEPIAPLAVWLTIIVDKRNGFHKEVIK